MTTIPAAGGRFVATGCNLNIEVIEANSDSLLSAKSDKRFEP